VKKFLALLLIPLVVLAATPVPVGADTPVGTAMELIKKVNELALQGYPVPSELNKAIRWFQKCWAYWELFMGTSLEMYHYNLLQGAAGEVIRLAGPWIKQVKGGPVIFPRILLEPSWSLVPGWRWDIRRN